NLMYKIQKAILENRLDMQSFIQYVQLIMQDLIISEAKV
ncbi:hypothetical protein CP02DC21_1965, partial [Chlamydia psittaci 02DC21]